MSHYFYVDLSGCENACEHCSEKQTIRVGHSAMGWAFSFNYLPDRNLVTIKDWYNLLLNKTLYDDYNKRYTDSEFWGYVVGKALNWGNVGKPRFDSKDIPMNMYIAGRSDKEMQ